MAYALVVSLKQTLEPLLNFITSRIQIPNSELQLIYDDLCYVKTFFDKMKSLEDSNNVEEVEKQIKDVLQDTQDLIECHLSDLAYSGDESSISGFSGGLVEVNRRLGALVRALKGKEGYLTGEQPSPADFGNGRNNNIVGLVDLAVSSTFDLARNNNIVGLGEELMNLKQRVLGEHGSRKVISIVGMGGIGKTTLAKEVYLDPLIIEHFDILAFVEVNIQYELKELLLRLVGQLVSKEMIADELELGLILHKYLFGRRYLIVLDDVWHIEAWDQLGRFFPDNANGSAIILTTRITDLAHVVCNYEDVVNKRFLNKEESWELLCKMAFSDAEECPMELEEIGKTIVENFGGLPLAIVMIAKLLSKSERTVGNWMAVAQNIRLPIRESTIPAFLNLSYTQLPQHLKACFLYLGLFPPNYSIPTSQLIRLWVAEGFINPVRERSLEQKAKEYLYDLVSRNLVIVHEVSSTGGIKTCRIHQLLQDLCVSEARQQKLFHIIDNDSTSSSQGTRNQRRLSIQSDLVQVMESFSGVRSLVFISLQDQHPLHRFRWLRVLHALSISYCKFPDEVLRLARLRYLAMTVDGELPSSISRLWSLEVLIIHPTQSVKSSVFLPLEIWKLQKLRHLECVGFDLPDPSTGHGNDLYLKKLLTLSGVSGRSCTDGVLARMPNLIKLGIRLEPITENAVETSCFDVVFTKLHQLESFKCAVMHPSEAAFSLKGFPTGLRKLTLGGCGFLWDEHITIIAQLPLLQVLKLRRSAFCGRELMLDEGQFLRLKFLLLEELDIEQWIAESDHFPVLEQLLIRRCYNLQVLPDGIGDIPTLTIIELDGCSMSLTESAKRIQQDQQSYGNDDLQVRIPSSLDIGDQVKITNPNYDTDLNFADSTAFFNYLKVKDSMTAEMDSISEAKMTPAPIQKPLSNEADHEIPLKTISQLHEDEKPGQFWVYAKISSIDRVGAWAYLACKLCFIKLEPDADDFFCTKCNTYNIGGRLRYNLTLRVTDGNGTAALHLWDCEFLKLIAETVCVLNEAGELDDLPMEIESLIDKKALFKVMVKEDQTINFTGAYSVTEVISDVVILKKFSYSVK